LGGYILLGSTGYVGQEIAPVFAKAADEGQFASFRILVGSPPKDTLLSLASDNVTIVQVDYTTQASLEDALKGVDILVSALGLRGTEIVEKNVVHAAASAGVKVYFPSEWGSDLEISPYKSPLLDRKHKHIAEAREAGLKTVVFVVGLFSESILLPIFGFWTPPNTLNIPDAGHHKVAFTSKKHVVQYALQAVLLVFEDPAHFPNKIRVWDDNRTWDDYALEIESAVGSKINKNYLPRDQLEKDFEIQPGLGGLVKLLTAKDLYDYSENHNELLNPGEKHFKRQSIEENLKETQVHAVAL